MKRFVCFLLALIMVLGMIPNTVVTANAASKLKTSAKAIEILMEKQGFKKDPYQVNGQWYIGYGSKIDKKEDYPNGITKEKAVELVRDEVTDDIDEAINNFTKKNHVDLKQNQHDALALYSFRTNNTSWLSGGNKLYEAVRTGKSGNDFINVIINSPSEPLVSYDELKVIANYRLSEANMYLNSGYGYNAPSSMSFAILDKNGNEKTDAGDKIVGYLVSGGYTLPRENDTTFLGWYKYDGKVDGKIEGAPITKLDKNTTGSRVVAKFAAAEGKETTAKYELSTTSLSSRKLFSKVYKESEYKSNIDEKAIDTLKAKSSFTVTKETMQDGIKWAYGSGKNEKNKDVSGWIYIGQVKDAVTKDPTPIASATLKEDLDIHEGATNNSTVVGPILKKGTTVNIYEIKVEKTESGNKNWGKVIVYGVEGWINLTKTEVDETTGKTDSAEGKTGKIVNAENVNIRKNAAIEANNIITTLKKGTKVTVLETKMNGSEQWGRVQWSDMKDGYTEGWIYMYYVELDGAPHSDPNNSNKTETVKYTGVVTSNTLNVRKSADIYAAKVKTLNNGAKVNVYETKTSRNMKWGRIGTNEWVCLTYLDLTEVKQPSSNTGATTTTSTQGTVTITTLNVLKNYNSNAQTVGTLKKGDVVTILEKNTEQTETGSRIWGRISKNGISGWINLAYVDLKNVISVTGGNTGSSTGTNNSNGAAAVIANCISVNIREGAGVANKQVTKLNNGTAVKVYDRVTKDGAPWAKITWDNGAKSGWVCMNYVNMSTANTGVTPDGGIVNGTNSNTISATGIVNSNIDLNVRSVAGLNGIKLGSLKKGARVTVYEQVSADGMIWGRIPYGNGSGWICMSYITVESASSTGKGVMGTIARCFAAANVRSAPGTGNALINKINVGTRVEVFETKQHGTQLWGRVAQGWVCMDYILLDTELPPGTALDATVPTTAPTQATEAEKEETVNRDGEIAFKVEAIILKDLDVRNDADEDSDRVGTVKAGLPVDIRAVKNNGAELWGRIDQYAIAGWIDMNKTNVNYMFKDMYVNTDEQSIYTDANMNSAVKGALNINTKLDITKITTDGTNVYGWVEEGIFGWIPMNKLSTEPVDVIHIFKDGAVGDTALAVVTGKTFSAMDAVDVIGGSKTIYKVTTGVDVAIEKVKLENGKVWGKISAFTRDGNTYDAAWIDMGKVNYSLMGTVVGTHINIRSSMDATSETNIISEYDEATVMVCQLAFDGYGNLWARVNQNANAALNGAFVMAKAAAQNVEGVAENYINLPDIF